MKKIDFGDMQKRNCEERYEIFLDIVAEEREFWILVNKNKEFLKIHSQDDDIEFLPIWPLEELTAEYSKDANETLTAKSLSLPEFFSKWVSGLERDGLNVGIFPVLGDDVWMMTPTELKNDIQDELSHFG